VLPKFGLHLTRHCGSSYPKTRQSRKKGGEVSVKEEKPPDDSGIGLELRRCGRTRFPVERQRLLLFRSERQELRALQRINQALNSTLDLDEVLSRIITEVASLLTARSVSVILHNDTTGEAELTTTYGRSATTQTFRYPLPGSLTGWVAEHQRTLRIPRLTREEWPIVWKLAEQLGAAPPPLAVLLAPLWVQGKVVGSLEAAWEPGHLITDHEKALLEAVTVQAAIAITNARLYQEKERALEAVQAAHQRTTGILESITDAFYALDRQWRFTCLNRQAEQLIRRTQAELLGKSLWEEFPETTQTITNRTFHQAMSEQVRADFEVFNLSLKAWFEVHAYPSRDGLAVYFHDISAHKQAKEDLRQAKEAAEAANRGKSEFLAMMSHELRTPLTVILGYTELLLEDTFGQLGEVQADSLRRIDGNAQELLDLITAVLDLSRLEAGRFPLARQEAQVSAILREVQVETQHLRERMQLAFIWEVEQTLPILYTDPGKLKIVLKNLIGNAVKFTPRGSITVAARRAREGVEIRVTDTGIGIPPEAQALIFEPFWQGETSLSSRTGGTGLGLHIVKRLLGLLGGTVAVESTVGHGTTFRVWVPLRSGSE